RRGVSVPRLEERQIDAAPQSQFGAKKRALEAGVTQFAAKKRRAGVGAPPPDPIEVRRHGIEQIGGRSAQKGQTQRIAGYLSMHRVLGKAPFPAKHLET